MRKLIVAVALAAVSLVALAKPAAAWPYYHRPYVRIVPEPVVPYYPRYYPPYYDPYYAPPPVVAAPPYRLHRPYYYGRWHHRHWR